jgi:hypothetical protein
MNKSLGKQIVVIDNGFVHVGECSLQEDMLRIDNCRNLRVWGTKSGLGELRSGPLEATQVDACGVVLVPFGRVVFFLAAGGGW